MPYRATQSHTGIYLAHRVTECLKEFGIENKVFAITVDNASNNDTMVDELAETLEGFQGSLTRVRCVCHIFNLVVKVIYIFQLNL